MLGVWGWSRNCGAGVETVNVVGLTLGIMGVPGRRVGLEGRTRFGMWYVEKKCVDML